MGGISSKGSCLGDTGVARRSTSDTSGSDATVLQQQQLAQEQLEQQQQWEYMLACYGMRPPIPPLPAIPEDIPGEEAEVLPNGQPRRRSAQPGTPPPLAASSATMSHAPGPAGASVGSVAGPAVAHPHAVAEGTQGWRPVLAESSFSDAEGSEGRDEDEPLGDESASGGSHTSWEDEHLRMSESACSEASDGDRLVLPPPSPTSSSTQLLELPEDALAMVLQHLHRGRDRHAFLHSCKALRDSAKCLAQLRTLTLFPSLHTEDADLQAQLASVPKGARITNLIIRAPVCDMHLLAPSILHGLSWHASLGSTSRVDFTQVEELQLKLASRCLDEPAASLAECLSIFPHLTRLTIKAPYISPLLLEQLSPRKGLRALTLNMAAERLSEAHYAAIGSICSLACLKLKNEVSEFEVGTEIEPDFDIRSHPLVEDVSQLSHLTSLQHLEVRHVKWYDDNSTPELRGLQSVLDSCPLKHLVLDTPARYPRLKCPATLQHLSLSGTSLQGLPELTEPPSLHVLDVPFLRVGVSEEGLLEQGGALQKVCSIPCFVCRDFEVCSSCKQGVSPCGGLLECLAESHAKVKGVRSLHFTRVRVDPEEVRQLGAYFPDVVSLSFSSCDLGPGCLAAAVQEFRGLESLYVWLCIKPRVKMLPHLPDAHELASVLERSHNLCLALSVNVDIFEQERDASCQDSVRSWRREIDENVPSDLRQRLVVSCWLNIKEAGGGCMYGKRI